jgi:hypothetical protein
MVEENVPRFDKVHDPSTNPELSRLYPDVVGAGSGQRSR